MINAKQILWEALDDNIAHDEIISTMKINDIVGDSIKECIRVRADSEIKAGYKLSDKFWSDTYDIILSSFEYALRHQCGLIEHRESDHVSE